MSLTYKQEAFAQAVVTGMNQSDAYRSAYNAGKMKPETINSKACILMADGNIRARVDSLKQELAEKSLWTRQDSVNTLKDVLNDPMARPSDKTGAVKVLNDMQGFNAPEKHIIEGAIVHRIELIPLV